MSEAETVNLGSQDEDESASESGFNDSREAEAHEAQPARTRASPVENVLEWAGPGRLTLGQAS